MDCTVTIINRFSRHSSGIEMKKKLFALLIPLFFFAFAFTVPAFACSRHTQNVTLTISAFSCNGQTGFGYVNTNIFGSGLTVTVPKGTTIIVYAHPAPGWTFEAFYINNVQVSDVSGLSDSTYILTLCQNVTLRVQFNPYYAYVPKIPDPPKFTLPTLIGHHPLSWFK